MSAKAMAQTLGADQHGARADMRKRGPHLIVDNRGASGDHLLQQKAQFRDIPLPVAKIDQGRPDGFVPAGREGPVDGGVGGQDPELVIQNHQRIAQRVDEADSMDMRAAQQTIEVPRSMAAPLLLS